MSASWLSEFDAAFPVVIQTREPASKWWLLDRSLSECAEKAVSRINDPALIESEHLLKQGTRRLVFRVNSSDSDYLVKAFPLDSIRKQLQHRKYACLEGENILRAHRLAIPSPKLLGFGFHRKWALIRWNAVCVEYLTAPNMELMLNSLNNEEQRYKLIQQAIPLFKILYETGCNHIDFKPGSIHMDGSRGKIIDFQYVAYLPRPSLQVVASQAGHFAWDVSVRNRWISSLKMDEWFSDLLENLEANGNDEVWSVFRRTKAKRYSIADRLNGIAGQV